MAKLTRDSLLTLEAYSRQRPQFRAAVMAHKKHRKVQLGDSVMLIFEDELTVRYQVQEMLRAERIFEDEGVQDELDAYNPLIPDGTNLKSTMMLEYPEVALRRRWLERLIGIEDKVWLQVDGCSRCWSIADEDLDRENDTKTSSVHFLRFELDENTIAGLKGGSRVTMGIDHPDYRCSVVLDEDTGASLAKDLS